MYVAKPGQSCTIRTCMLEYTCLLLGEYLGGVQISLIINFMSFYAISDIFENKFKCGSNVRIDSNLLYINLITLLVTLLCKWGQIITRYDFLGAR